MSMYILPEYIFLYQWSMSDRVERRSGYLQKYILFQWITFKIWWKNISREYKDNRGIERVRTKLVLSYKPLVQISYLSLNVTSHTTGIGEIYQQYLCLLSKKTKGARSIEVENVLKEVRTTLKHPELDGSRKMARRGLTIAGVVSKG